MKRLSIFVCAAALMGTAAFAAGGMMGKVDVNKDGKITQQEADAAHAARFAAIDINKDGFIDASEAQKAEAGRWEKMKERRADAKAGGKGGHDGKHMHWGHGPGGMGMFEDADANRDGKVSKAEFLAASDGRFDDMDFNKDGYLDQSDFEAHRAACEAGKILCGPMARLDTNKDGKVSKAEFMNGPRPMFERMDTNKNGVIDQSEMAAGMKGRGHGMGMGSDMMGPDMGPGAPPKQ